MKLSYNWLKQFVEIKSNPEELADKLTILGFEIEHIEYLGKDLETVVVGEIKEINKHPEADRLQIAQVEVGDKNGGELTIVCGAPNIAVGQKVPVALIGTKLKIGDEEVEIRQSKIRGVESFGMMCAEDELGLGTSHEGILLLDHKAKVGQKLAEALDLSDVVYEFDVPANRGDVWSHLGMAREISAIEGSKLKPLEIKLKKYQANHKIGGLLEVKVEDEKLCPKYTAKIVKNIKLKPSPAKVQNFLRACGVRPINNVVDVTNFVMLAVGQPLHAFDLAELNTGKIIVRRAKTGEKMVTLDGIEREFDDSMLLITDGEKATAIAGIMGGLGSGISDKTVDVVIESAQFNYASIRKTSQRLGLRSESSSRFERHIDWQISEIALEMAVKMLADLAEGEIVKEEIYLTDKDFYKPLNVELKSELVNRILGGNFTDKEIEKNLKAFDFAIIKNTKDKFVVAVPSWRNDIKLPIDLVEEVGRLNDFNSLGQTVPMIEARPVTLSNSLLLDKKLRNLLVGVGFDEVLNYPFHGEVDEQERLEVDNPINPDQKYLRRSLVVGLEKNLLENLKNFDTVKIFEIGRVFFPSDEMMPVEKKMLAIGCLLSKNVEDNFYYLKGVLKNVFEIAGVKKMDYVEKAGSVEMKRGKKILGVINFVKDGGVIAEIDLAEILVSFGKITKYQPIINYPAVERDLSILIDKKVNYQSIVELIQKVDKLVVEVVLFDIFESASKIGQDKKSMAFHLKFQSPNKTLTMIEVDTVFNLIVKKLHDEFGAELRS
ncbi:MAG: phenylalanine--tRNA ligase subunit beta [Patescibacteria group bacterium]